MPTLPFEVLRKLYDSTPLTTDDGRLLRRISINIGVVHLLLACLGIFTHQTQNNQQKESKARDDRGQLYWAKGKILHKSLVIFQFLIIVCNKLFSFSVLILLISGTGFGTGSTQQSWNVEQALLKQRSEEEHVTILLQVLSSYINPNGEDAEILSGNVLPPTFHTLLAKSSLLPAFSSYLRNDSGKDFIGFYYLIKIN